MLVKYGGGIVGASGSMAGNTHARNRFGNYIRARTKPVNPNSTQQGLVRTSLSFLTNQWSAELTPAERISWGVYAAAIAMKNRLGESIFLTGFNHFIRSNVESYRHGNNIVEAGPAVLTLPEKDIAFACTGSVATQLISVAFTENTDWALEAGAIMYLYQGVPRSPTRLFFNGPWKYLGQILGDVAPGAQSPQTKAAVMTLVLGQVVTCYARIRRADGRISEPFTSTFTVAA